MWVGRVRCLPARLVSRQDWTLATSNNLRPLHHRQPHHPHPQSHRLVPSIMMSLWGDSDARPSSFSSRPVYLRSASSPATAIPKPPVNGPLSLRPTPIPVSWSFQPSSFSSPNTVTSDGDEPTALAWQPPSPPVSEIRELAIDQVMSFVHERELLALAETQQNYTFSMIREFPNIAPSTHECILRKLECKLFEYNPKVR